MCGTFRQLMSVEARRFVLSGRVQIRQIAAVWDEDAIDSLGASSQAENRRNATRKAKPGVSETKTESTAA